jgi:hypothetical protein
VRKHAMDSAAGIPGGHDRGETVQPVVVRGTEGEEAVERDPFFKLNVLGGLMILLAILSLALSVVRIVLVAGGG